MGQSCGENGKWTARKPIGGHHEERKSWRNGEQKRKRNWRLLIEKISAREVRKKKTVIDKC